MINLNVTMRGPLKLVDLVPIWPIWLSCWPTWSRFHGGKAIDLPEILRAILQSWRGENRNGVKWYCATIIGPYDYCWTHINIGIFSLGLLLNVTLAIVPTPILRTASTGVDMTKIRMATIQICCHIYVNNIYQHIFLESIAICKFWICSRALMHQRQICTGLSIVQHWSKYESSSWLWFTRSQNQLAFFSQLKPLAGLDQPPMKSQLLSTINVSNPSLFSGGQNPSSCIQCKQSFGPTAVVDSVANVFIFILFFELWMPRKLAKTMRIFVEIDHIENQGGHIFTRKNWTGISHAMEWSWVQSRFFSGQNLMVFNMVYLHKYSHGFS